MSLHHVSTLKGSSSGSTCDTFEQQRQQNESPSVQFSLICGVYCVPQHMAATVHGTHVQLECTKCTPWRLPFKGWNMVEWRIVLIEWWPNQTWLHLSVFTWYSDISAQIWTTYRNQMLKMQIQYTAAKTLC